jgi:phage repressor protein C with HTH and peptisase S24 domain
MSTITQVIDTLQNLTNAKVNQSDIARALNITRATVSARVKTSSQVTLEEIEKLEKVYNVDLKPQKLSPETVEKLKTQIYALKDELNKMQKFKSDTVEESEDCILLPVRGNLSASMGYGIEIADETSTGFYPIPKILARSLGLSKNLSEYVPAEGDSMLPTIEGGSMLIVDHTRKDVIDGKIYCVRLNNKLMAKRLQFLPPNRINVISDNPKYKPFEVDLSKELDYDFAIIGEVRWWGTIAR